MRIDFRTQRATEKKVNDATGRQIVTKLDQTDT